LHEGCKIILSHVLFICDAPARSFLQCIIGHTCKNGCAYCEITCTWCNGRVTFPYCYSAPRTDTNYSLCLENNQLQLSPLAGLVELRNASSRIYAFCLSGYREKIVALLHETNKRS
jgi:hypothetical protein